MGNLFGKECPIYTGRFAYYMSINYLCTYSLHIFLQNWRFETLGAIKNPITALLDPIEKLCYKNWTSFTPCDAFLVAVFIDDNVIRKASEHHVSIELHGRLCRGQVVLDHLYKEKPNCTIVEVINEDLFERMLMETAGHDI
jgi:inosine-uridine nucleoside N-ribohydrolase